MNWSAIGAVADLVAAAGVIASLVYLAIQIRNSSKVNRLSVRESYVSGHTQIFQQVLENPEVFRVWQWASRSESADELSDDDRERFGILLYSLFYQMYVAYEANQIDATMGSNYLLQLDRALQWPAVQSWWARQHSYFDPRFAQFVDQRIALIKSNQSE